MTVLNQVLKMDSADPFDDYISRSLTGKPWAIEYYADHGKIFSTDEVVNTDARKSIITFQPVGVIDSVDNAIEFSLLAGSEICSPFVNDWKYYHIKTS